MHPRVCASAANRAMLTFKQRRRSGKYLGGYVMDGLQPTFDINGNNNGWGDWGGALIGGAIGGAVGSAWNGNRWNNGGCGGGNCCNNGNQFIADTLTTMRTDVNSIGRDQLIQTTNLNSAMCEGFGRAISAVQGVGADLATGQARTEAAVLTTGLQGQIQAKDNTIFGLQASHAAEVQGMRNTFDIVSSQKDCCCATQRLIESCCCETNRNIERQGCDTRAALHAEGEATRALISQIDRERLLREMSAKDAKIAQLEAQQFNSALAAGTSQQTRNDMQSMLTTILGHMAAFRTTTGSTAAAA